MDIDDIPRTAPVIYVSLIRLGKGMLLFVAKRCPFYRLKSTWSLIIFPQGWLSLDLFLTFEEVEIVGSWFRSSRKKRTPRMFLSHCRCMNKYSRLW